MHMQYNQYNDKGVFGFRSHMYAWQPNNLDRNCRREILFNKDLTLEGPQH